jgi:transposase InsO family protein
VYRTFAHHARCYGTRRLRAELQAAGYPVGRCRIRRVLRQHGLRAQQPRSFVPRTTDSGHGQRVAPNRPARAGAGSTWQLAGCVLA